jgi:chemotaxis protein MotB
MKPKTAARLAASFLAAFFLASCGANKELVMRNENLASSLRESNARNAELETKLAETENSLRTADAALRRREEELGALAVRLDDAGGQIDDLQVRLGEVREALQSAFAQRDYLAHAVEELQGTLRASESEKTRRIAELSRGNQDRETQIIDLKSELGRARRRGDDLALRVSGMQSDIAEKDAAIVELKSEGATLLRTIGDLNATFKERTDDLSAQVSRLIERNEDLGRALEAASRRNQQQGDAIEEYRRTVSDQAATIEELGASAGLLETEKRKLEFKITAIERDRSMLIEEEELEKRRLKDNYESLLARLKGEVDAKTIEVQNFKDALTINMMDKIFFDSGKTVIKPEGLGVLDRIAPILKNLEDKNIRIEGHTDDVPISAGMRSRFPSNWELGAARSSAVARYFAETHGIDPARISAVSYSSHRPIAPNSSEENRARNRRIEIVLIDRSLYEMVERKDVE